MRYYFSVCSLLSGSSAAAHTNSLAIIGLRCRDISNNHGTWGLSGTYTNLLDRRAYMRVIPCNTMILFDWALLCVITTQILERVTQWSRNDPPTTSWRSESLPSQTTINLNARDTDVLSISLAAPCRRSPDIHVATQLFTGTHTHTYTTSYLIPRFIIRVWLTIYSMNPMINAIRSNDRMKWFSVVRGVRERRGVPSIGAWWVDSLVDTLVTQGPSLLQWPASISSTPYSTYVYYIHLAISILLSLLLLLFDFLLVVCGYCVVSWAPYHSYHSNNNPSCSSYYYYYLPLVVG